MVDVARQKRRLAIALAVTVACLIIALAALIGMFSFHVAWMVWVLGAALIAGFGSHGWLMVGLMREDKS
jgi:hypothetical protein